MPATRNPHAAHAATRNPSTALDARRYAYRNPPPADIHQPTEQPSTPTRILSARVASSVCRYACGAVRDAVDAVQRVPWTSTPSRIAARVAATGGVALPTAELEHAFVRTHVPLNARTRPGDLGRDEPGFWEGVPCCTYSRGDVVGTVAGVYLQREGAV